MRCADEDAEQDTQDGSFNDDFENEFDIELFLGFFFLLQRFVFYISQNLSFLSKTYSGENDAAYIIYLKRRNPVTAAIKAYRAIISHQE